MSIQQKWVGVVLCCFMMSSLGCSYSQNVKDVWKGTKSLWYSNVNVPASIDYDETGELDDYQEVLAASMVGIDKQLTDLERVMGNADRPPTNEWIRTLFTRFPWISGFSGIKTDGALLGQVPGPPIKPLDFAPLLEGDNKDEERSLRTVVQDTAMGPEILLATPLYDAHTFLGVVTTYFDMRSLLQYSSSPQDLIILAPNALLWAGKYNFASTPMSGIAWDTITLEASSGTVSNASGTFYWTMRYLGNVPLIFGVAVEGSFAEQMNERTGPTSDKEFPPPPPRPELAEPEEPVVQEAPKPQPSPRPAARRPAPQKAPEPAPVMRPSPLHPAPARTTPSPLHPAPADAPEAPVSDEAVESDAAPETPAATPEAEAPAATSETAAPEAAQEESSASSEEESSASSEEESSTSTHPALRRASPLHPAPAEPATEAPAQASTPEAPASESAADAPAEESAAE